MSSETDGSMRANGRCGLNHLAQNLNGTSYRPVPTRGNISIFGADSDGSGIQIIRATNPPASSGGGDGAGTKQTTLDGGDAVLDGIFKYSSKGSSSSRKSSGKSYRSGGKGGYFNRILNELDCAEKGSSYSVKDRSKASELEKRVRWLETAFKEDGPAPAPQQAPAENVALPSGGNGTLNGGDGVDLVMSILYRIKALRRYGLPQNAVSEIDLMTEDLNQLVKLMNSTAPPTN